MENFIEELLEDVYQKEQKLQIEHIDLTLVRIRELQETISTNWLNAEREMQIIKDFYLSKNSKLHDRIVFLEKKLNAFMLEDTSRRSLDLPNGTIRLRKGREKVVVEDLSEFLQNKYSPELVNIKQEIKPDMKKLKEFIRMSSKVPAGVKVIFGNENEFSYKLREVNNEQT